MSRQRLTAAFFLSALLASSACGEPATFENPGGTGGGAGAGGSAGAGGAGEAGGAGGDSYQVCTLGLCMDDEDLATSCQEVYDTCVGQGHYTRCCRMDADKTCGVFGETGPY